MVQSFVRALVTVSVLATVGCTTNVENPTVNQQGRGGDTCVVTCDSDRTTCIAKCSEEQCKAACETTHTQCVSSCPVPDAG
jgi:hypothetical protein